MIDKLEELDRNLLLILNSRHNPFFDDLMWWISGKYTWAPFYFFIICIAFMYLKKKAIPLILLIVVLIAMSDFISSGIFKPLFQRLRPSHDPSLQGIIHLVNEYKGGKYGFISSHACNAFAVAFYFLFTVNDKIPWLKYVLFPWAIVVSYSRIYLGVHFPGDIIVPVFLSIPIAIFVKHLYLILLSKFFPQKN